jgi:hypothetical protein
MAKGYNSDSSASGQMARQDRHFLKIDRLGTKAKSSMLFGHNSNVNVREATFHVQTEDRGVNTALIDTTVYHNGRVMHRRTNNYHDLVPLNPDREEALRLRLDEQHRATLEDIRTGALYLVPPEPHAAALKPPRIEEMPRQEPLGDAAQADANGATPPAIGPAGASGGIAAALKLDLRNARTWLTGKQARLEVSVFTASGEPQPGVKVIAHIEGAATAENYSSETNADGCVEISFDMPRLAGGEAALVIEALQNHSDSQNNGAAHGKLRFALRGKPRDS